jgi:hypothetical protein
MPDRGATIRRRRLWERPAAVRAYSLARSAAERIGLQIVLKTYYSPIPDLATVPADVWQKPNPMPGIELDLDAQVRLLETQLGEELRGFAPDEAIDAQFQYDPANPSYPPPDARLLFALIRHHRPHTIVELGSGQSSRVIAQACRANDGSGQRSSYRVFDPFADDTVSELPGVSDLLRIDARAVPGDVFEDLRAGDMLIVDTTHTVKLAGEVNRLILQVLPSLAPGVLVHFHDIHLPYEYPRYLARDYGLYWTEQYLLQAFLSMNCGYGVLYAVNALCRDRPDAAAATGLAMPGEVGGAFWIQRSPDSRQANPR